MSQRGLPMRRRLCVLLLASFSLGADDAKEDKETLQGRWTVVTAERDGRAFPEAKEDRIVFAGDKLTVKIKDRMHDATYQLDPNKHPKRIVIVSADAQEKPLKGIYQLEGDSLKICLGKDQPVEFAARAGTEQVLLILKRDKS
jgi:uncharacterized protein (TIGR03067 family)